MAFPLEFIAAGGTIQFGWYTETGDLDYQKYQPSEYTAGDVRFGFTSKAVDKTIDCSMSMLSQAEADALQGFFDTTVDGMQKTFTYRDNIKGVDTVVRFGSPELQITPVAFNVLSTRFKLLVI